MRKGIIGLLILFSFSLFPAYSATPPQAGSVCSKQGVTKTYKGKKYVCIKSGKKSVWSKGKVVKKPTPTTFPTPTPTPSRSASESPKSSPNSDTDTKSTIPSLPTGFGDLYEKRNGIAYAAWKSTTDKINSAQSRKIKYSIFIGPSTLLPKSASPEFAMDSVSRAFDVYSLPEHVFFIQYSIEDREWAKKKFQELLDSLSYKDFGDSTYISLLIEKNCGEGDCGGALQVGTNSGISFVLQGISKMGSLASPDYYDALISHEFFHSMQRSTIIGSKMKEWPTSWIFEGSAQLIENLVRTGNSFDEYLRVRKSIPSTIYGKNSKITASFMADYLDLRSNNDYFRSVDQYYAYHLGSYVMELLVAIKGPHVLLDLYRETSINGFETGFASIFGITWLEASPIINKTIVEILRGED
jgi:hypothetical protein